MYMVLKITLVIFCSHKINWKFNS